jgi:hypothetical protein
MCRRKFRSSTAIFIFYMVQNVAEMQNQVADLEIEVEVWQALAHQG